DSSTALRFYYWRQSVNAALGEKEARVVSEKINDFMAVLKREKAKPDALTEEQKRGFVKALADGMARMRKNHGTLDANSGDVFRVGRDDKSWPVGGGSLTEEGLATLRAISFEPPRPDHTRWGRSGQTSTQVIVLTKPIQSWTQPPIGQSGR